MTNLNSWRAAVVIAACALTAAVAFAGDVLDEYQRKYTKTAFVKDREDLLAALVATGKPEAVKALNYCAGVSRSSIEDARENVEKLRPKLDAAKAKYDAKLTEYAEEQRKLGRTDIKSIPSWPEQQEFLKAQSDVMAAEKAVFAEVMLLDAALDAQGRLVAKLPAEAQNAVRADWTKNRLAVKDWNLRAECYEVLGHTATDWAFEMLAAAVSEKESDPRALTSAIDGLAGRDAAKAVPLLAAKVEDVRWTVRVAAVAALEMTPSKEGIDAIVKRMAKEDGRLRDDCARALRALTGHDITSNAEMWRVWWAANREKWNGKPPAKDPDALPNPGGDLGAAPPPADPSKETGFFGIKIDSRRVVFVIDVSGSMNDPMGGAGPEGKLSKADVMKKELKQVLSTLEDGVLFDMVFFSSACRVWKPEMQTADPKTRQEAIAYVEATNVIGGTGTYDALEAAFMLGDMGKGRKRESDPTGDARVDTIMFLSDGKPTEGRQTKPDDIRAAVKSWNKARRIAIHSIAFGAGAKDGADPKFMRGLAEDTGGTYVAK
jgi:hypothetical protein